MVMYMDDIKPYHYKVHGYEKQLMQAQVVPLQASAQMKNKFKHWHNSLNSMHRFITQIINILSLGKNYLPWHFICTKAPAQIWNVSWIRHTKKQGCIMQLWGKWIMFVELTWDSNHGPRLLVYESDDSFLKKKTTRRRSMSTVLSQRKLRWPL